MLREIKEDNVRKLLIVWIDYKCGFKVHNTYIEVTERYNIQRILRQFKWDLERFDNIREYCILNIMEL